MMHLLSLHISLKSDSLLMAYRQLQHYVSDHLYQDVWIDSIRPLYSVSIMDRWGRANLTVCKRKTSLVFKISSLSC